MKIHRGDTALPTKVTVSLPAIRANGCEYQSFRNLPVRKFFGFSIGERFVFGLMLFGNAEHSERRVPICEGWDDPEERCPRHPKDCVCWQGRARP